MPQFVIEREMPGAGRMTEDEVRDTSLRSLERLQWHMPVIQYPVDQLRHDLADR